MTGRQTANIERFGVFLPSFVWPSDGPERARGILDFAREVENAGFDSIFITDHLFAAKQFYSVSFLEPLTALSLVAGVTERVKLGTSVMVMPIREPVLLAKQLATLQFLSNNRVVLGAGIGWYPPEYAATGVKKSERGPRTDEILEIIVPLLEGKTVTYQGRFYSIEDVLIEPRSSQRPEVWIGGGSQLADPGSPDLPRLVDAVKKRILAAEGWVPRPTCPPEDIARDWEELQVYFKENGRDPADLIIAHENFFHFVSTQDPIRARQEQHEAMTKVMSEARGPRVPGAGLPLRDSRRGGGVTAGQGRCRCPILHAPHHDTGPGSARAVGNPHHPPRSLSHSSRVTQRVALIGNPLKRRHSAVMHNAAFDAHGIDASFELRPIGPEDLDPFFAEARGEDWLGFGVTAPYKQAAMDHLDEIEAGATRDRRGEQRGAT